MRKVKSHMAGSDAIEQLRAFPKTRDFFVGIDSDGCAFDTMAIKQQECFIPNTVYHYGLQAVSRFVRETQEWVNLRSAWRGSNRFPALVKVFDLLAERPEALERGYRLPPLEPLRRWIEQESQLGNPALQAKVAETNDPVLARALRWSTEINAAVAKIVRGVPPFPHVRDALEKIAQAADVMVVSATPIGAVRREWQEHTIDRCAAMICGQELGKKAEHLHYAAGGRYDPDRTLMIGDALGDLEAARDNQACFYPIEPGDEAASWRRFVDEAADKFLAGQYRGADEDALVDDFLARLPSTPPWPTL